MPAVDEGLAGVAEQRVSDLEVSLEGTFRMVLAL